LSLLTCGLIGVGLLLLFLVIGVPVGISMIASGFIGTVLAADTNVALSIVQLIPFGKTADFSMIVVPLFLSMGELAFRAGLSDEAYYAMQKILGHVRGGLVMATIGGCAAFAAVCGSSLATAVTMTRIALPEMVKYKTDKALATGGLAAGGTLGILIPPSVGFIVYAIITEQSIGKLFLAGVLPGVMLALLFMLTIYILVWLNPHLSAVTARAPFREMLIATARGWGVFFLFLFVIGGIYFGIFSPTEAAGIGAVGAFFLGLFKKKLTWQNFWESLRAAAGTVGMIFLIIIGAFVFSRFLALTRLTQEMSAFMVSLPVSRYAILAVVLVFFVCLGCIMEIIASMFIALPIIFPVISALGFDPIWFGVIIVIIMEMGLITPPVGLNVYAIAGVARDIPMPTIFRGVIPFVATMVVCLIILILFPQIALLLPNTLR
jgi:C4-dicarboxylate transporter DctM subunit